MGDRNAMVSIINSDDIDQGDIMNIFLSYGIDYSTNSNGIFINLSLIDDKTITDIYNQIKSMVAHDNPELNDKYIKQVSFNTSLNASVKPDKIVLKDIDIYLLSLSNHILSI